MASIVVGCEDRGLDAGSTCKLYSQEPKSFNVRKESGLPAAYLDLDLEPASFSKSHLSLKMAELSGSQPFQYACAHQRGQDVEHAQSSVGFAHWVKPGRVSSRQYSNTYGSDAFSGSLKRVFSSDCSGERSEIKDIAVSRLMLITRSREQERRDLEEAANRAEELADAEAYVEEEEGEDEEQARAFQERREYLRPVRRTVRGKPRSLLKSYFGSLMNISSVARPRVPGSDA
ncbi:hypothetical protein FVE85_0083 [Porphyridium purpureum]|uniref:Uncharacterized protein n=1 Tax=Porphyridium purpureum TaxID=35688 RepID=A0A5J4Z049_PORPP|nr:hypothetical protein FVE85_0083 [Porphyridium purpureum]|eukprot:POR5970..scf208_2